MFNYACACTNSIKNVCVRVCMCEQTSVVSARVGLGQCIKHCRSPVIDASCSEIYDPATAKLFSAGVDSIFS